MKEETQSNLALLAVVLFCVTSVVVIVNSAVESRVEAECHGEYRRGFDEARELLVSDELYACIERHPQYASSEFMGVDDDDLLRQCFRADAANGIQMTMGAK